MVKVPSALTATLPSPGSWITFQPLDHLPALELVARRRGRGQSDRVAGIGVRLRGEHDLLGDSSSAAQSGGRYRERPIRACPAGDAQVRVTATWHIAIPRRARRPQPSSSNYGHPVPTAARSPYRGRSGGFPGGRSTELSGPSGHRAVRHGRHDLSWQQQLPGRCCVPQADMITAVAPASSVSTYLGAASAQRDAPE